MCQSFLIPIFGSAFQGFTKIMGNSEIRTTLWHAIVNIGVYGMDTVPNCWYDLAKEKKRLVCNNETSFFFKKKWPSSPTVTNHGNLIILSVSSFNLSVTFRLIRTLKKLNHNMKTLIDLVKSKNSI